MIPTAMALSGSRTMGVAVKASTIAPPKYVTTSPNTAPQKIVTSKLASHVVFNSKLLQCGQAGLTFWLSVSKSSRVCKLINRIHNFYIIVLSKENPHHQWQKSSAPTIQVLGTERLSWPLWQANVPHYSNPQANLIRRPFAEHIGDSIVPATAGQSCSR